MGRRRSARAKLVRLALPLLALLYLLAVESVEAQERSPVKVAVLADWPPEYMVDEEGRPDGFAIDLVEAIAERAGLSLVYESYSTYAEAISALERGDVDLIPSLGTSEERRQRMAFTSPIDTFVISIFVREESTTIRRLDQLAGRPVAVVDANIAVDLLEQRGGLDLRRYPDVRSALYDLLAGQVDALAYPRPVVEGMAERARLTGRLRPLDEPLAEVKRAMAVRKDDAELLARLDEAVLQMVGDREYEAIYGRWFATPPQFWTVGRVTWASFALLAVMLAGVGLWRLRTKHALARVDEEREAAERALGATTSRHRAVMDHAQDGVFVIDCNGLVLEVNPRGGELLGYAPDELVGKSLLTLIAPAWHEQHRVHLAKLFSGEALLFEREVVRKDGERLAVEVSARQIDGETAVSVVRDISERKRNEKAWREHERMLHQAQKMEALARLSKSVAHDFNNILTVIVAGTDVVADEIPHGNSEELDEIRKAALRGAELCRQLLATGREQKVEAEKLWPRDVLEDLAPMLERLLPAEVGLDLEIEAEKPVAVDGGRLEQVVTNLVINARDALPGGGTIRLRARDVHFDEPFRVASGLVPAGDHVCIEVEDEGLGMDEGIVQRIFEPFFTTKEEGAGTGLGLSTVLGIVQQSGGYIDVESRLGEGSRFAVYLKAGRGDPARGLTGASGAASPRSDHA